MGFSRQGYWSGLPFPSPGGSSQPRDQTPVSRIVGETMGKQLGIQTLGGRKQSLVCTRTQEKGAMAPQETDQDLPVSVQESLEEAWVGGGLRQRWGTECVSACTGPCEGGHHYLQNLHQVF